MSWIRINNHDFMNECMNGDTIETYYNPTLWTPKFLSFYVGTEGTILSRLRFTDHSFIGADHYFSVALYEEKDVNTMGDSYWVNLEHKELVRLFRDEEPVRVNDFMDKICNAFENRIKETGLMGISELKYIAEQVRNS